MRESALFASVQCQEIGWEERLANECDVNLNSNSSLFAEYLGADIEAAKSQVVSSTFYVPAVVAAAICWLS